MESVHGTSSEQSQLLGVVRGVRNRYRAKLALRGAAITIAAGWVVLFVAGVAMNVFNYADASCCGRAFVAIVAILGIVVWFIVRPLLPKLRDEQVALYLEEHEKSPQATVITAVEMQSVRARRDVGAALAGDHRPADAQRARARAQAGDGRAIDAGELKINGGILAAVMVARDPVHAVRPARSAPRRAARSRRRGRGDAGDPVQHRRRPGQRDGRERRRRADRSAPARLPVGSRRAARAQRRFDVWTRLPMTAGQHRPLRVPSVRHRRQDAVRRRSERRAIDHVHDRRLESAVREADGPAVPLSGVHAAAAERRRQHGRHRGAQGHDGAHSRRADGADARAAASSSTAATRSSSCPTRRRQADGDAARRQTGLLQGRASGTGREHGHRLARLHDRRASRSPADGAVHEAGARSEGALGRRGLHRSARRGRLRRREAGSRVLGERRARAALCRCTTARRRSATSRPATRSCSRDSSSSRATSSRTTRARPTTTRVSGPQKASTDIYFLQVRPFENEYRQQQGGGGAVAAAAAAERREPTLAEAARDHRGDVQDGARQRADRQEIVRRESCHAPPVAAAPARADEPAREPARRARHLDV